MKPTSNTPIAASSFIQVGVATAIIVLQFIAREWICVLYVLICNGTWLSFDYLIPIWCVILQPVGVYPFIRRWQKTHTGQIEN